MLPLHSRCFSIWFVLVVWVSCNGVIWAGKGWTSQPLSSADYSMSGFSPQLPSQHAKKPLMWTQLLWLKGFFSIERRRADSSLRQGKPTPKGRGFRLVGTCSISWQFGWVAGTFGNRSQFNFIRQLCRRKWRRLLTAFFNHEKQALETASRMDSDFSVTRY